MFSARALAAGTILLTASSSLAQAETFTISWWGFNGDKLNANIVEPFEEMCGCEVIFETGNNADRLGKLTARGGKGVDVIYLTDSYSQIGVESGIFQPIDRSKIPNIEKLYDMAKAPQGEFGPAYTVGRAGIVYDSADVEPITEWNDLWRDDLKGQIALPGITTTAGPMVVVRAGDLAGVDAYTDTDGAFANIEAIEPNVVKTYNTGSEMINLMSTNEANVSIAQDFALRSLKEAVPSIVWADLEDGDIATLNTINISGRREKRRTGSQVHQFRAFDRDPEAQRRNRCRCSGQHRSRIVGGRGRWLDLRSGSCRQAEPHGLRQDECRQVRLDRSLERSFRNVIQMTFVMRGGSS